MFTRLLNHFRRQKIASQQHFVELLDEAYANHPIPEYWDRRERERLILLDMQERWKL